MRIHRLTLRNFRGIHETTVTFDAPGVTIVEGPNEVGKSSLAEAIDVLFDKPDSSTDRQVQALKPVDRDEGAEVELEFSTGPYRLHYAKRWHKNRRTILQVLEPVAGNLTGREAHDRVREILDETLDVHLWGALRHQQGVAITQAALDQSQSLAAALDAAASGAGLSDPGATALFEAATAERDRYWTPGRRQATRDRADRGRRLEQVRQDVRDLEQALAAIDQLVEEHGRLTREIGELDSRLAREQAAFEERRARVDELGRSELEVERLARDADRAAEQYRNADRVAAARSALLQQVAEARQRLAELQAEDAREAPALEEAERLEQQAGAELEGARRAREAAERRHARARADLDHWRALVDLERRREQLERVAAAQRERAEAQAVLQTSSLDEAGLQRVEEAWHRVQAARAALEAAAGKVRVEALAPLEVELRERRLTLSAGETHEETVGQGLELHLPGLARVRVETGEHERTEALRAAEAALARLAAELGLDPADPVADARERVRRRRDAEGRLERAEQALRDRLEGLAEEELADLVRSLEARVEAARQARGAEDPLPVDLPTAEREEADALRSLDETRRAQSRAEEVHARAREELARAEEAARQRQVALEEARRNLAALEARLAMERQEQPDEAVAQVLAEARRIADEAEAAARQAREALEQADPESQRTLLANAEASLDRLRKERVEHAGRLREVATELRLNGERGLHDQLEDARARARALEDEHEAVERRAEAALLLFDVLDRHRAEAKARYLGPLRAEIERLGRVVFGPSLSVELDPETFQVVKRTLEGVTVPYDSLSTGAKEQLCLLSRLACARLVARQATSPGGEGGPQTDTGVPVLIDDALGYSDPDRLERLGAVLAEAGRDAQVVVLTCVPERYRAVGTARAVRLEPGATRGGAGGPALADCPPAASAPPDAPVADPTPPMADPASLAPAIPNRAPAAPPAGSPDKDVPGERRRRNGVAADSARVLACLRQAGRPLGRSEILAATGLDEARWPATIRHLLDTGQVLQEGARRGARYRPAEP
jgi:DNA repair exonuclease SbcCD ATPase subunit